MMTPESLQYRPDYAVTPGETLLEVLEDRGMTQADLARRMSRPTKTINEIIKGKAALTAETSLQLEAVLGIPAGFWLNRETRFREVLARRARLSDLTSEVGRLSEFPSAALAKLRLVQATRIPEEKVAQLRSFFGVDSLANLASVYEPVLRAARRPTPGALMAWLRIADLYAQESQVAIFNGTDLRKRIDDLRALTLQEPEEWSPRLRDIMAECGVRIVYVPHLPQTYAHGATRWHLGAPLVQLSVRGRYEDIFWFSLFHEIGHILRGHSRKGILIAWDDEGHKDNLEHEADHFAANALIPPNDYGRFTQRGTFSEAAVRDFAAQIGVCPGIVVGRLHHEDLLPYTYLNSLRRKLQIQTQD